METETDKSQGCTARKETSTMTDGSTPAIRDRFLGTAFHALTEISKILRDAVVAKQDFTINFDASKNDGSCDILIRIEPSKLIQ